MTLTVECVQVRASACKCVQVRACLVPGTAAEQGETMRRQKVNIDFQGMYVKADTVVENGCD